jgi:hypothetical protein
MAGAPWRTLVLASVLLFAGAQGTPEVLKDCDATAIGEIALSDLGTGTYQGHAGGLYPDGANTPPLLHATLGDAKARLVTPRNTLGLPDPDGAIVFLSIGMSNTRQHFGAFVPMSLSDPQRDPAVRPVNGAIGGQHAGLISNPNAPYWSQVDEILASQGYTPAQVQAVWMLQAIPGPVAPFPDHAHHLVGLFDEIIDIMTLRFPNLKVVHLSNRIYAGYATTALNPEPWAYENGFAVKWTVEQRMQPALAVAGPWVGWGPDLWADGTTPRSDGLTWECNDLAWDGTHPSGAGANKAARGLRDFVHEDEIASLWYKGAA